MFRDVEQHEQGLSGVSPVEWICRHSEQRRAVARGHLARTLNRPAPRSHSWLPLVLLTRAPESGRAQAVISLRNS